MKAPAQYYPAAVNASLTSRSFCLAPRVPSCRGKVYLTSAAPPVRYPNVYGIDIPTKTELVAHNRTAEQVKPGDTTRPSNSCCRGCEAWGGVAKAALEGNALAISTYGVYYPSFGQKQPIYP